MKPKPKRKLLLKVHEPKLRNGCRESKPYEFDGKGIRTMLLGDCEFHPQNENETKRKKKSALEFGSCESLSSLSGVADRRKERVRVVSLWNQ